MTACAHQPGKVDAAPCDWGRCTSSCTGCGIPLETVWQDYGDPDGAAGRWSPWRPIRARTAVAR